ncbi:hypothetical protein LguiB_002287 [Lonicera macranthoides]
MITTRFLLKRLLLSSSFRRRRNVDSGKDVKGDVSEKKVDFFKCLKKVPIRMVKLLVQSRTYMATRSTGLPPKWDSPSALLFWLTNQKVSSFSVKMKEAEVPSDYLVMLMDFIHSLWKVAQACQSENGRACWDPRSYAGTLDPKFIQIAHSQL